MQGVVANHVDSFNFFLEDGLNHAVGNIHPVELIVNGTVVSLDFLEASISLPTEIIGKGATSERLCYPSECRERRITYRGRLTARMEVKVGGGDPWVFEKTLGQVPIMVKSTRCHLDGLTPAELIEKHEEAEEMGGYFIVNGNEKIVRQLILPRRHQIMALNRPSFTNRGKNYTEYGCTIRCVRADQSSQSLVLHYKSDGTCVVGLSHRKQQYLIPAVLLLRAFTECTDRQVYDAIVQGDNTNTFIVERVQLMLREFQDEGLYGQNACLSYLGNKFKVVLNVPDRYTDAEVGKVLLDRLIFVHLDSSDSKGKFNMLVLMMRKLYFLVSGSCTVDNADSAMNQELLLPGHLYGMVTKELLQEYLLGIKKNIELDVRLGKDGIQFDDPKYIKKQLGRQKDIGKKLEFLMATGNLNSPSGLDLMQVSGFTIVADKLNFFRYISHFRCVHRGAFFTTMKTTTVRKLLPESWGFLCPVHTPDGSPCGLLNHLTGSCKAVNAFSDTVELPGLLESLGVVRSETARATADDMVVVLDGKVVGFLANGSAQSVADQLRMLKVTGDDRIPPTTEIALVLPSVRGQYPGMYLFTQPARMIRPVHNLRANKQEWIGTFEQVYMDIGIVGDDYKSGVTTHMEEKATNFISVIANMTPFSDHNQSPRNMYQCQMGKQTMGFPCHAYKHRADNKLYCLRTPQTPMVRTKAYDDYNMDTYPIGTNAVVAVISYTGFDMEDAMILNKSAKERGFAQACVVATKLLNLDDMPGDKSRKLYFGCPPDDGAVTKGQLDVDGFPCIGARIDKGDPLYGYIDANTGAGKIERYKGEPAQILQITRPGNMADGKALQQATIKLSIDRNPVIGDKFASRHGQKGICSLMWPAADMPFTESGMVPDIMFNPHGFPSRMTIGMLVESMAGKSAALHGVAHDATPFNFNEDQPASKYFGEQLSNAGYNYHGTERMYSGITGEEFDADIFIGVVYYQRLRHMVSDKFQVRTTGPVHSLTHQPIKGRKRAGGIRFGEMERDSLLSHGTSFLLQDRLTHCSDESETLVCKRCGSLLSPVLEPIQGMSARRVQRCADPACKAAVPDGQSDPCVVPIAVPYVFRYLVAELLAMNVKLQLTIKEEQ